jgi:hypothetical protein
MLRVPQVWILQTVGRFSGTTPSPEIPFTNRHRALELMPKLASPVGNNLPQVIYLKYIKECELLEKQFSCRQADMVL